MFSTAHVEDFAPAMNNLMDTLKILYTFQVDGLGIYILCSRALGAPVQKKKPFNQKYKWIDDVHAKF
jgi:hypothetical protein